MFTINRLLDFLVTVVAIVTIPCKFVTTLVLGFLGSLPLIGLVILLLLSFIWMMFYGVLMLLGKLIDTCPEMLGLPVGLLGLPIAFVGSIWVNLMPDMGEKKAKAVKQMTIDSWPYTTDFYRFTTTGKASQGDFVRVLESFSRVPQYRMVIEELMGQ